MWATDHRLPNGAQRMSVANNQRFKAGPQCLYTMPLFITDNERAEFTAADGTLLQTDKTAGEGHAPAPSVATPAGARSAVMHFGGLQGRPGAGDPTAFLNIEDGNAMAGYTTHGVDVGGRKHVVVAGQANLFDVRVTKAPMTGTRVVPRLAGGNETVVDYATTGGAINAELTAHRCIRAYYLPWRSNAATTMRLGNAADYFVTSTLTGCTFAVYGARTAPTVTHANNGAQQDLNLSQDYMGKLLDQIRADEADVTNLGLQGNEARFTTHDYKLRADPYLNKKIDKDYKIHQAKTHTVVVGYRDTTNGEWSFYTQQVVVVGYERTGLKGFFGQKHKRRIFIKQARRVWPAGGGLVNANLWT